MTAYQLEGHYWLGKFDRSCGKESKRRMGSAAGRESGTDTSPATRHSKADSLPVEAMG